MELKSIVFIVLCQILILEVFGEITLSFKDFVATVTPVKPNSASLSSSEFRLPPVPKVPNLSESVIEYFKFQLPESDRKLPIVSSFSSPLIVTSISRPIPLKKLKSKNNDPSLHNVPDLPFNECENNVLGAKSSLQCTLPGIPIQLSMPITSQFSPVRYSTEKIQHPNEILSCPEIRDEFAPQITSIIPQTTLSLGEDISLTAVESGQPREYLNRLGRNTNNCMLMPTCNNYPSYLSPTATNLNPLLFSTVPSQNIYSFTSLSDPLYCLPYPLRHEQLSLPEVITSGKETSNCLSNLYPEECTSSLQPFIAENLIRDQILPPLFTQSYIPIGNVESIIPQTCPCKIKDIFYTLNLKIPSTELFTEENICKYPIIRTRESLQSEKSIKPNCVELPVLPFCVELQEFPQEFPYDHKSISDICLGQTDSIPGVMNEIESIIEDSSSYVIPDILPSIDTYVDTLNVNLRNSYDILDSQADIDIHSTLPEYTDCILEFPPLQEICIENAIPEMSFVPSLSNKSFETCKAQISPFRLVGVSPSHSFRESCNISSALNDSVKKIAQNITAHFMSYIKAKSKKSKNNSRKNPFIATQSRPNVQCCPILSPTETNPIISMNSLIETTRERSESMIPTPSSSPSFTNPTTSSDDKFSLLNVISSVVSKSPDLSLGVMESPSADGDVLDLPSAAFDDNFVSLPCYLSPSINPTNLDISLPVLENKATCIKSLKSKPKTLQKFLELIFLAELLNDEEDIDWNAIDAALKFLSVT